MNKRTFLIPALLAIVVSLAPAPANAISPEVEAFLYEGLSYLQLKSAATTLEAPLNWNSDSGQAVMSYQGQDLVLRPNSVNAVFGGQNVTLSAPPRMINGVMYVPVDTLKKLYKVPVTWDRTTSEVRIQGPQGWKTVKARSQTPWHGGPPPWAPAWGQRRNTSPNHPYEYKHNDDGKAKKWGKTHSNAPGNSGKAKSKRNKKDK